MLGSMGDQHMGTIRSSALRLKAGLALTPLFLSSCAPSPAPPPAAPQPEPVATPQPQPEPTPEPALSDEKTEESPPLPTPVPEQDLAPERVAAICETTCGKMDGACSSRAANFCRASCRDYVSAAQKCPVEVEDALSCQGEADDFLLCSNIAAESCAPLFRDMKNCRDGLSEPKTRSASDSEETEFPEGFTRVRFDAEGFSLVAPTNTQATGAGLTFSAQGQDAQGIEYLAAALKTEGKKPDASRILRAATAYVGLACQPKLRLHGRYENHDVIHVRFDTVCEDGSAFHGMLHFWNNQGIATTTRHSAELASQENPQLESFLFSFELLSSESP